MQNRAAVAVVLAVIVAAIMVGIFGFGGADPVAPPTDSQDTRQGDGVDPAAAGLSAGEQAQLPIDAGVERAEVDSKRAKTGVRGIVIDAKTREPLGGVEVVAVRDQPSLAPLVDRFRGLFQSGMMVDTRAPRRELGSTISNPDGTFELTGLPPGRLFLDGRSDGWFVRTAVSTRLAEGQIVEGLELRASPGGRVRGIVLGADGAPIPGASVSVRPGLNAFLGQITDRQYRWLDTVTDAGGQFDIPGVPEGNGYTVSTTAPSIALEEVHGVSVTAGQVTSLTVQGHLGATVAGVVLDTDGAPMKDANVAMVYLDISRVLFSADGRSEPLVTDAEGRFRIEHVGAGRVAFVGVAGGQAPSNIAELAVVDGGVYDDLVLQLGIGETVTGTVVDDRDEPVADATVEIRPFERPNDPQFLKMMLKIRRLEVQTDAAGRFVAKGLTGERLVIQASKSGYTTSVTSGVKLDDPEIVVRVQRGVTIRGKVVVAAAEGEGEDALKPVTRFRVETRTREIPRDKDGNVIAADASSERSRRRGFRSRMRGGDGAPWRRKRTRQLPEGKRMADRDINGNWQEVQSDDGTFELTGIPPGRIRLRLRSDGLLPPDNQTIDLEPGETSDLLVFECGRGEPVSGRVVDESGTPISDAQVTAYKQGEKGERRGLGRMFRVDQEDFDFLALSTNQRAAITDSLGRFTVPALAPGEYRFTARHPDLAKASTTDVKVEVDVPTPPVEITIDAGGAVEGNVTGLGMRPLPDALMVAFSLQAGSMRSGTTDRSGYYRIDGLPPGQYVVFKSRLDERADNIPLELMSNMRLKTVTVRRGKVARLDVHDESEDGVRVFGVVRENGAPVPRALVALLGSDRDGILGMGMRCSAADMQGRYQLPGIKPGDYVMQVTRFQGQPVQTTFEVEIPEDVGEFVFDIDLPTSTIYGRVIDTRGNPVKSIQVSLATADSGLAGAGGLMGMIAENGIAQARTDENGEFKLKSVAAGTYSLTAGRRMGPRRRGGAAENYGEGSIDDVIVDGVTELRDVVVTVPLAGRITGLVLDGSNAPVANAEVVYEREGEKRKSRGNPLLDLVSAQRPVRSDEQGRFEIKGLTPGTYSLRVESDALEAGTLDDVDVIEDQESSVTLRMVRGATIKVRAVNVDKKQIPFANLTLLDGRGKRVVSRVSTLSVMKRLMGSRDNVDDSGWFSFGNVPPDTYTIVIEERGKPELRISRTIRDGETVEWDIDVQAELEAREADGKK